eukprot:CAMPEP_0183462708 /NCGR_PEP_ID=MMETSP0370-20130417/142201_1 /TAXON_ID=268820 /ORGANISM="Peridinium aciculiferum, Strain PAER-2" /LENGTH=111 /DNA_ID=CAMNT_0025654755 /DNA_START=145 /DNA_END=480 /DNA_ORIENTATION=+
MACANGFRWCKFSMHTALAPGYFDVVHPNHFASCTTSRLLIRLEAKPELVSALAPSMNDVHHICGFALGACARPVPRQAENRNLATRTTAGGQVNHVLVLAVTATNSLPVR